MGNTQGPQTLTQHTGLEHGHNKRTLCISILLFCIMILWIEAGPCMLGKQCSLEEGGVMLMYLSPSKHSDLSDGSPTQQIEQLRLKWLSDLPDLVQPRRSSWDLVVVVELCP
jgi:hypothetical protein